MKLESVDIESFLVSKIEALVLILGLTYFTYAHGELFWFIAFIVFCFLRAMTRFENHEKSIRDLEQEVKLLKLLYDSLRAVNKEAN